MIFFYNKSEQNLNGMVTFHKEKKMFYQKILNFCNQIVDSQLIGYFNILQFDFVVLENNLQRLDVIFIHCECFVKRLLKENNWNKYFAK